MHLKTTCSPTTLRSQISQVLLIRPLSVSLLIGHLVPLGELVRRGAEVLLHLLNLGLACCFQIRFVFNLV